MAPEQIIIPTLSTQGRSFNKVHLLPLVLLPSLLPWRSLLFHLPCSSNCSTRDQEQAYSAEVLDQPSIRSQCPPRLLFLLPKYWESPLTSAAVSNCFYGCASLSPGSEVPPVVTCADFLERFFGFLLIIKLQYIVHPPDRGKQQQLQ